MALQSQQLNCGECGLILDHQSGLSVEQRPPCPKCGSQKRAFHIEVMDTVEVHDMIGIKGKRPGEKRPFIEQKSGDDLFRKTGKWMKLFRKLDRDNDSYIEEINDPETGEIIHQKNEPLSEHQGYGSEKKQIKLKGSNI